MKVHLTPKKGRTVLMLGTHRPMPAEGIDTEWNTHWERRMHDGDVDVEFLKDEPAAKVAPEEATKSQAPTAAKPNKS